jgi:hypothetical protein
MEEMQGTFSRKTPSSIAENIELPLGWFVVSWRWIDVKATRRRSHGRLYRISSGEQGVYRILRFSTGLKGGCKQGSGEIAIDWPAWLELNDFAEEIHNELELKLEPAPRWQLWRLAFSHPDPAYRLAGILGVVSVGLGVLSILLALIAFA